MQDLLARKCLAVTHEIAEHPLSFLFRKPFITHETDRATRESYTSIIQKPMDLKTVADRIKEYTSLEAWASDMRLIFDNAIRYNRGDQVIVGMAQFLKDMLEKRIEKIQYSNVRNFEERLISLTREMNELLENPPVKFGVVGEKCVAIGDTDDFTRDRLDSLMAALNKKLAEGKMSEIVAILEENGESVTLGVEKAVDLATVSRGALNALEKYVHSV